MNREHDDLGRPDEGQGRISYNVEVGGATDGPVVAGSYNLVVDARHGSSVTVGRTERERRYRLGSVEPEPHAPVDELSVSQLLAARNGVVEFTGRGAELDELRHWCAMPNANRAALLIHGPGGQGKTRLATQFAAEARRTGWHVVAARHVGDSTGAHGHVFGDEARGLAESAGVLVLVDYAERWPTEDLFSMADDLVTAQDMPVRLLLMARSIGWWTSVRHEFTERWFEAGQLCLGPLAAGVIDRNSLFDEARDRFADVLGVPGAHRIPRPADLAGDAFGLVLAVHMAALAAVDAYAGDRQAPADPVAISAYLLDREFAYWQRLCSAGRVRIRPSTMARTVFTATLTRPLPYRHAVSLLERVGVPSASEPADTVLADHGCCYPPTDPDTVLEPLYPDRLAEDFLALLLPGHDVSAYRPDAWTSTVPIQLLDATTGDSATPPSTDVNRAALTMLVEAAGRWPHLVQRQLIPLLRTRPELALAAGSAVLSALAELSGMDMEVLATIESQFPPRRQVHLDPGIADVTARLVEHQLSSEQDPSVRATRLAHLADRLDAAGRHEEGLAAITEAVRIRRGLADVLPPFFRPALARSLLSLSNQLTQLGRHEDALAAVAESLDIFHPLAEREPDVYRDKVALALDRLGNCLSRLGRYTEALTAAHDAVRIRRALAAADPAADRADLGQALQNHAVELATVNRFEDALANGQEALRIFRRLAAANPQGYQAELALALNNLSGSWYRLGQLDQARDAAREAVDLYRDLVAANPSAFRFPLSRALHNLGNVLSDLGHPAEGLTHNEEAVRIRRDLAAANPRAFTADLARSLDGLAADLIELGRRDRAVSIATEAVDILRPMADRNPLALRRELAGAQIRLSQALSAAGQAEPALAAAHSAVTEYHVLAAADPVMFWPELADALNVLGNRLSTLHRWLEALPHRKKAARISRVLARDGTLESRDRLAGLLENLAISLISVDSTTEALVAMRESLRHRRDLAKENPERFRHELAWALSHIGVYLSRFERWQEAYETAAEAVELYRALVETDPATYTPHLARSLNNCGVWLCALGRQPDAQASLVEAISLRERLAADDPDAFGDQLADSIDLLNLLTNRTF